MKICQSLFEYVGNPLYKSDNVLEAGVWRIYWHGLPGPRRTHLCKYILQTPASLALSLKYIRVGLNLEFWKRLQDSKKKKRKLELN